MPLYNASAVPKQQNSAKTTKQKRLFFDFSTYFVLVQGKYKKNIFFKLYAHDFCCFINNVHRIKTQNYAKSRRDMQHAYLSETLRNFAFLFYLFQMIFFHAIGERLTAHSH